ncbi:MoaD/ThiS family protein [Flavobacterium phycosphaerae]|uniref:MoaD/ThiS family protein n=1 Tax=Flavobacterium phycosphaerae TaxID=2697515 RepID=UPI00138B090F|nr:MoaD/ThiS family protein [Flavobacterium phycosphaerae]
MKTIKCTVKYYGIIRDILETDSDVAEFSAFIPTLNDIKLVLEKSAPEIKKVEYLFAVNQKIVSNLKLVLKHNDEIALLPAFSGG